MMGAISGLRFCLQIVAFTLFMIQNEALDLFESPLYCNLGVRLEGFVAETYQLRSKTQCALKCSENPDCQSFSFETLNKTADFKTCEINTATTDRRGNNIVNDTGFIYYEKVEQRAGENCELLGDTLDTYAQVNVRIQSRNYPTYFFTYDTSDNGKILFNDQHSYNVLSPGLTGQPGTISIESTAKPGHFFRFRTDSWSVDLWGPGPHDWHQETYHADCTFWPRYDLWFDTWMALESVRYPGKFITHGSYKLSLTDYTDSDGYRNNGAFKFVDGSTYLHESVQIQSINFQSYYFSYDGNLYGYILNGDTKKFKIRSPGLIGYDGSISIESIDKPRWFLRYRSNDWKVYLEDATSPGYSSSTFNADASFYLRQDVTWNGWFGFESVNRPNYWLRHTGYRMYMHSNVQTSQDSGYRFVFN